MATTSRYFYAPMRQKRISHRLTILERIQRRINLRKYRKEYPDVYMVTGYFPPVYPRR